VITRVFRARTYPGTEDEFARFVQEPGVPFPGTRPDLAALALYEGGRAPRPPSMSSTR
jgi:hypothetical protein